MTAWRQGLVAAVAACVLMHAGLAHATKDCGLKGCPATQQNDPQGQQQQPQTLERIYVHAQRTQQAFPLPWVNYSGLPPVNFGLGNAHGPGEFRSNNYVTVTDQSRNRDNQDCKGTAGDPIELSTTAKIESLVLFQLPGEMGLRFELDYTSTGGWHDNLDYELDPFCGSNDQCYFTTLRRPDGSTVTFHGSYAGTYQGKTEVGGGGLATLDHNADGTYVVHDEDGSTQTYNQYASLIGIKDESGIGWTISYAPNLKRITDAGGRYFTIASQYNSSTGKDAVTVTDPAGHAYQFESSYAFGNYGQINNLTRPGTPATVINYTYSGYRLTEVDYNGVPYSYTTYDSSGRATGTHLADGSEATSIVYTFPSSGKMTAAITDPLGHTTTNQYTMFVDSYGAGQQYMLTSSSESALSDCGASVETEAYDSNGNPTKIIDNDGVTHTYGYAVNGQLQTETEAYGTAVARKTDYVWDSNQQLNRLLSMTVEGHSKASYTYNAQNRLASVTRTNLTAVGTANESLTTSYAYALYANGTVKTMTVAAPSPSGTDKTTYQYDAYGNVTSVTDGLGHATTYTGYNALGEPGHVTGPNGDVTDFTYDARGRLASKTTHPNGVAATWIYAYDSYGLLHTITAPDAEVTTWNRDAEMRVNSITHNDKDGTSTESFGYDANGDVTSDVIERGTDVGKSQTFVYDGLGRIYQAKGANGQVLTYAYDGNGNVLSVTDALGHATTYAYDDLNRLEGSMDAAGGVTSYTYDAGDHVTRVTDPRQLVTTYNYDGLGLLWKQVSPDTGTTSFNYDAYGRLVSKTRTDGTQITYAYDALNRLTSEAAGGVTRTYTWDVCTDGKGRLCAASNQGYDSVGYSYSPEGWITGRSFSFNGGPTYGLGYAYDNMGHLAAVNYPDGNQAVYQYTDGAVSYVAISAGPNKDGWMAGNITYRPMDMAMSGWTTQNGSVNTIQYDSDLRPISISVPNVENLAFAYDSANRITQITNGLNSSQSQTLGYDALNRLTTISSSPETASLSYDADGNRTYQVVNGAAATFNYAAYNNQLMSVSNGTTYGYNADGDLTTVNGLTTYQYGPFDRLSNAAGWAYETSAEGQRIRKSGGGDYAYLAPDATDALMAEDDNGTWFDYVWLNGRLIGLTVNGGVFSIHDDQTGRPVAMTTPNTPNIAWATWNEPFGHPWVYTNTFGNFNLGFPGQYWDSESGLWHNGNRDYNPYTGRYIESDPIGLAGGINTYAYVGNNPVSNVDPLGLCGCTRLQKIAAELGSMYGTESEVTGTLAAGGFAATLVSGGLEAPTLGGDTPVTAGLGLASGLLATSSATSGFLSAALNAYAGGGITSFRGYAAEEVSDFAMKLTASSVPGAAKAADLLGSLAGKIMGSATAPPLPPCQQQ